MNGFLYDFCSNIEVASYTSPFNQYEDSEFVYNAIIQAYDKNNYPNLIFVPICEDNHWTIVILDFEKRKYFYFDSMKKATTQGNSMILETIDHLRTRRNVVFDYHQFSHKSQSGLWECGYHVLMMSYKYAMGHSMDISPIIVENLKYYLHEIVNKTNRFELYCAVCLKVLENGKRKQCSSCKNNICRSCRCPN